MKQFIKENILKNIILVLLIMILYYPISSYLINSSLVADKVSSGNILVAASIIAVIACFGNFAFTYEKVNIKKTYHKLLAHITTGILMLIIGISLMFTAILISFIMGHFILIDLTLISLYIACVGYDFWDILRVS